MKQTKRSAAPAVASLFFILYALSLRVDAPSPVAVKCVVVVLFGAAGFALSSAMCACAKRYIHMPTDY